jgi:hypothetical protein
VLENLVPHLRLIGLPERAILGTDEDLGANGLRLRDIGFMGGNSSERVGGLDGRLLGFLFRCWKAVGRDCSAEA